MSWEYQFIANNHQGKMKNMCVCMQANLKKKCGTGREFSIFRGVIRNSLGVNYHFISLQ